MRIITCSVLIAIIALLSACSSARDHVLREPLTVTLEGGKQAVLPAGTELRERWFKDGVCAIELTGSARASDLYKAAGAEPAK